MVSNVNFLNRASTNGLLFFLFFFPVGGFFVFLRWVGGLSLVGDSLSLLKVLRA